VPAYGYETPVRVCKHCYGLLNEEVLCDFDESDIDIDQWNCVHLQNVANADNIGRKPNKFLRAFSSSGRTRTGTVTSSGYTSSTTSPNDVEDDDGGGGESGGEEEDPYGSESEGSTISNNSIDESSVFTGDSSSISENGSKKTWPKFKQMFGSASLRNLTKVKGAI
jgi:hypothetical protein